jgi:hypothetical protein
MVETQLRRRGIRNHQELRQICKIGSRPVWRMLGYCRFVSPTGARGWQLKES